MRFCIATPTLNRCGFLRQSIASVLSQQGVDVHLRVIDGGSTDGTQDYLRSIRDPRLSWTSLPGLGQAAAINAGLASEQGDIHAWLNDDDVYVPGALHIVREAFIRRPDAQWLAGRCQIIDKCSQFIRRGISSYKDRALAHYRYNALLQENFIGQPGVFWRGHFGTAIGPLDESLEYAMDYDLWLRMGRAAAPLILRDRLACFRFHPGSKSGRVTRRQFTEQYLVGRRHLAGNKAAMFRHRLNVEKSSGRIA